MADQKFTIDVSQAIAQLQGVDKALSGLSNKFTETSEKSSGAFVEGTEGALKEAAALDRLQKEYNDLLQAINKLKAAQKNATDPRAINAFAKEIARGEAGLKKYEQAANAVGASLKKTSEGVNLVKDVTNNLIGTVTKATIIVAVIQETIKLFTELANRSGDIKKATLQFENFTGSAESAKIQVESLQKFAQSKFLNTQEVLNAGKSLLAFGVEAGEVENSLSRIADISSATGKDFTELTTIYGKARTAGVLYAEDINQLVDAGIPIIQEFAKQLGVSEGEVKKLASEGKISFEELQLAFFNLTKEGEKFANAAELQGETFSGAWSKVGNTIFSALKPVGDFLEKALTDLAKGISELFDLIRIFNETDFSITDLFTNRDAVVAEIAKIKTAERQEKEKQAKLDLEQEKKTQERLEQEAAKGRILAAQKANAKVAAERKKQREKEAEDALRFEEEKNRFILSIQQDGIEKDLALAKMRYEANLAQAKKYGLDTLAVEEAYWNDTVEIVEKYSADAAKAVEEALSERTTNEGQIRETAQQLANAEIDIQEEKYRQAIEGLKKQGVDEKRIQEAQAAADIQIQRLRLTQQIEFEKQRLSVLQASGDASAGVLQKQIELLELQLAGLSSTFGADAAAAGGDQKGLLDILGINISPDELEGIRKAVGETIGLVQQAAQARVDAANAARKAADDEVAAAEARLQKEIELSEKGFASNVSLRQREFEIAKANQQKAIENQRKAQRTQILLDSAIQASNLATTVTELFKSLSKIPLGLGIPIAIALSATMFAAFAKSKADALRATRARYGVNGVLGEDGLVKGKPHSMGGNRLEIERGEFFSVGSDGKKDRLSVVRKERTTEYWDLLDAANRNDKKALAKNAFALAGMDAAGIVTPQIKMKKIARRNGGEAAVATQINIEKNNPNDRKQTALLQAILGEMQRQNKSERWTPDGKTRVSGNTTTKFV